MFNINKSQISIGLNYLEVKAFKCNKFYKNKGLDWEFYKLFSMKKMNFSKFEKYQPLTIVKKKHCL